LRTVVTLALTALVAGVIAVALSSHWSGPPAGAPIRVEGQRVIVENRTAQEWQGVSVTINAYYRATKPAVEPGGRLELPLANLETWLGHRFDVAREHVSRVEVRATDASGKPVSIDWGETGR
jgi:hypothetical protein